MAVFINLFQNWLLTKPSSAIKPGAAAITGADADLSTWIDRGTLFTGNDEPHIYSKQGVTGITLSGGHYWYDFNIDVSYAGHNPELDDTAEGSTPLYNREFCGKYQWSVNNTIYDSFICIWRTQAPVDLRYIRFGFYTQSPQDADTPERTAYNYNLNIWTIFDSIAAQDSPYTQVRLYRAFLGYTNYYLIVCGVAGNGTYTASSTFYLIPTFYFDDKEPRPWTGQETESNSENAYTPTTPYRGSVLPRDLTNKRNPYGFNSGNGLTLAVITFEEYAAILQGIYAGSAESVLNKLSQGWATIVGGNTHRPADEVQAITSAILACHMIPQLTGYVSGSMTLRTIAGYHILGGNASESVTLSLWTTKNTIFEFETSTYYIQRRLNSFLDFEPYTTIILHLPFMPTVDIKPSILYGNGLKIHYKIDIFTGVLSADIIIVDSGNSSQDVPREFILTTLQTNVKTDIPIMGNAAQSGMFSSLTNALVSSVGAESYGGLVAGGIGAADMLSKMSTGQAVGQSKIDGIGAYLSNRQPYLIITRPNPANPPNYNQLAGIPSNMGGKVGDYCRANTSQNLQYTEFAAVDLSGIAATDQEKTEIESLLKSGVFI